VPKFKIAHIKQDDVNLIIVPLAPAFGELAANEKDQIITLLQDCSVAAQLRGRVVPVWDGGGRMHFIAPPEWHNFFRTLKLRTVRAHLNREIDFDAAPAATGDETEGAAQTLAETPVLSENMRDLLVQLDPRMAWPGTEAPSLLTRLARLIGLAR
jgi:hypothetical protein